MTTIDKGTLHLLCSTLEELSSSLMNGAMCFSLEGVYGWRNDLKPMENAHWYLSEHYEVIQSCVRLSAIVSAMVCDYLGEE